jgi:hypothetical protein
MVAIVAVRQMRVASVAEGPGRAVADVIDHKDDCERDGDELSVTIDEIDEGEGYWFNFADYATEDEATRALSGWIQSIAKEVEHGRASDTPSDAESREGYRSPSEVRLEAASGKTE